MPKTRGPSVDAAKAADAVINYQRITEAIDRHKLLQRDIQVMLVMVDSLTAGAKAYLSIDNAGMPVIIPTDTATIALQTLVASKTAEATALAAALDNLAKGLP